MNSFKPGHDAEILKADTEPSICNMHAMLRIKFAQQLLS